MSTLLKARPIEAFGLYERQLSRGLHIGFTYTECRLSVIQPDDITTVSYLCQPEAVPLPGTAQSPSGLCCWGQMSPLGASLASQPSAGAATAGNWATPPGLPGWLRLGSGHSGVTPPPAQFFLIQRVQQRVLLRAPLPLHPVNSIKEVLFTGLCQDCTTAEAAQR